MFNTTCKLLPGAQPSGQKMARGLIQWLAITLTGMKTYARILILLITLLPISAFAQQQGPYSPSSTENQPLASCSICTGAIWDSTENVSAIDGQFASVTLDPYLNCFQSACYRSRYLTCYNFGFNIPANAVIEGVSIDVAGIPSSNGSVRDCTIVLRRDNLNNLYGTNMASTTPWNTNQPDHSYGSSTELWGLTWTPADVNSPDFGTYIKLYNPTANQKSAYIDAVYITVTYSIGMNTFSATSSPQTVTAFHDAANQTLNITTNFPANTDCEILVTDVLGKTVLRQNISAGDATSVRIETAFLVPGIYTCTVTSGSKAYTIKFVK
jgi:hypothetical protein